MEIAVHLSDCVAWLRAHVDAGGDLFDACVTDPPYHLTSIVRRFGKAGAAPAKTGATGAYARASRGFMGKAWDGGDIAFDPDTWRAVFDALKPGAHLIAFSGTRTYHRMACAIEDAGFEIRDQLAWVYGSGFPKSHDIAKAIDKAAGIWRGRAGSPVADDPRRAFGQHYEQTDNGDLATDAARAWQGWGTALKPAWEPICLARKPIGEKSIAANVLAHGTGAINIDGCRIPVPDRASAAGFAPLSHGHPAPGMAAPADISGAGATPPKADATNARFPANLCHDGSAEVLAGFPDTASGKLLTHHRRSGGSGIGTFEIRERTGEECNWGGDSGSASRFFYSAKAGPIDRIGTKHATVKPVDLMRWLVRMVTPPGGRVLDPFGGSGATGKACMAEGFDCTLIDIEAEHVADMERTFAYLRGEGRHALIEHDRKLAHGEDRPADLGPLFVGLGQ